MSDPMHGSLRSTRRTSRRRLAATVGVVWATFAAGVTACLSPATPSSPINTQPSADEPTPTAEESAEPVTSVLASASASAPILASSAIVRPKLLVVSGSEEVHIEPSSTSLVVGLFRAGQTIPLMDEKPVESNETKSYCKMGWYQVLPYGFVCPGYHSTPDLNARRGRAMADIVPDPTKLFPYSVGVSIGAPRYKRVPNMDELLWHETQWKKHIANPPGPNEQGVIDMSQSGVDMPDVVRDVLYPPESQKPAYDDNAYKGMKLAWTKEYKVNGRSYLATSDKALVPKDKVRVKPPSDFRGVKLTKDGEMSLPVAFVPRKPAKKYTRDDKGKLVATEGEFDRHAFIPVKGKTFVEGGVTYIETRSGNFLRTDEVNVIRQGGKRPITVGATDKWIRISIFQSSLISFVGDEPTFVTAISAGVGGGQAEKNGTLMGRFAVSWKHVSADMAGRDGSSSYRVAEVPWIIYFKDSYAIHAAWWHDDFGNPKSHGCINLSPLDAKYIFDWVDPPLPEGWYGAGARPFHAGTFIEIVP